MTGEEKDIVDREVYESAYKRMKKYGISSILTSPRLIKKRELIKERIVSYYENTEEYEKCNFLKDFFDQIEKEIKLNGIITDLGNINKESDKK